VEGSPTQRSLTKGSNEERVCEFWQIIIIYRQIVVKITLKGKKYSHFPWKSSNFVADKPMLDKLTINAR
jgi:hypothetical protein